MSALLYRPRIAGRTVSCLIGPVLRENSLSQKERRGGVGEYTEIATETRAKCWILDMLETKEIAHAIEEI